MNRRSFLISSGTVGSVLLAGCTTPSKQDPQPVQEERPQITTVTSALPDGVDISVELVNSNPHTEEPLTLNVSLQNTSDTDYSYAEARTAKFIAASDDKFYLYPADQYDNPDTYQYNSEHGVWVAKQSYVQTMDYQTATIEAGETHSQVLRLLHQKPQDGESISTYPDELNFDIEFKMAESSDSILNEDGGQTVRAAFSLLPPLKSEE